MCDPKVFILGSEFLPVVQSVQKDLTTVQNYICTGAEVPDDMIDYKSIAAYEDVSEAMVDVDDQHDLAMMFTLRYHGYTEARTPYPLFPEQHGIGNGMSYFVEKK